VVKLNKIFVTLAAYEKSTVVGILLDPTVDDQKPTTEVISLPASGATAKHLKAAVEALKVEPVKEMDGSQYCYAMEAKVLPYFRAMFKLDDSKIEAHMKEMYNLPPEGEITKENAMQKIEGYSLLKKFDKIL